jgi:hypothetical protein
LDFAPEKKLIEKIKYYFVNSKFIFQLTQYVKIKQKCKK